MAEVTSASPSSGVMATDSGGPTTLAGTAISAITFGEPPLRSSTVRVSGAGFCTTWTAPLTSTTLLSFTEIASWASAAAGAIPRISSRLHIERMTHLPGLTRAGRGVSEHRVR